MSSPRRPRSPAAAESPSPPPPSARAVALARLGDILDQHRPWDGIDGTDTAGLDARDRALVRKLVTTVLRRHGQLSALIDGMMETPLRPGPARRALLLGAAQLLFMRIPDHAAVAATVGLLDRGRGGALKGVVNAVLRRIARTRDTLRSGLPPAETNLPAWLRASWAETQGPDRLPAIAESLMADPPLDLTPRTPGSAAALAARLQAAGLEATTVGHDTVRLADTTAVADMPGFADGAWWVQDVAAALPATLLPVAPGQPTIDLCAAPGGKTAQLAARGAAVTAVEIHPGRMARLRDNLARLQLPARIVEADATTWTPPAPVPAVLLDAPCTATGTIRRHPDILHTKRPGDVATMAAVQDALLANAASMVAPGGVLVFATCSLQAEEGRIRVAQFLQTQPNFQIDRLSPRDIGPGFADACCADGTVWTLPTDCPPLGADGFFIARFRRQGP